MLTARDKTTALFSIAAGLLILIGARELTERMIFSKESTQVTMHPIDIGKTSAESVMIGRGKTMQEFKSLELMFIIDRPPTKDDRDHGIMRMNDGTWLVTERPDELARGHWRSDEIAALDEHEACRHFPESIVLSADWTTMTICGQAARTCSGDHNAQQAFRRGKLWCVCGAVSGRMPWRVIRPE